MNITREQLLARVKTARNITGEYHDGRVLTYIDEVKQYLLGAGVPAAVLETDTVVGIITIGVDDLMEEKALSAYFKERAIQLALSPATEEASV